jgi:uncharacterized protein YjiS (DUF1127 family)
MESVIDSLAYSRNSASSSLLSGMRRWYQEWRMANALAALDDATLKDIGICRCGIPWTLAPSALPTRHDMDQPSPTLAADRRQVSFLLVDML